MIAEVMVLTDLVFGAVRASSRKGDLLTNQQIIDLVSSRDLKDLVNRVKERYPFLATATPSLKGIEEGLLRSYRDEVYEFMKVTPDLAPLLKMAAREVEEHEVAEALKVQLGILPSEHAGGQRRQNREEIIAQFSQKGFASEAKSAVEIYERYKVPGLIDAVFARQRILNMTKAEGRAARSITEELAEYIKLKIDTFNMDVLLRGIKNGVERNALAEVVIFGGTIPKKLLLDALKQTDIRKVLTIIEAAGIPKVDSPRSLERYYESKISTLMSRTYYSGYGGAGAIMSYLELKLREIRNIIRIANAINLGIDPKKTVQDFIF